MTFQSIMASDSQFYYEKLIQSPELQNILDEQPNSRITSISSLRGKNNFLIRINSERENKRLSCEYNLMLNQKESAFLLIYTKCSQY